jgi:hypothetical protein
VSVGSGDRGLDGAVVVEPQALGLRERPLELAGARRRGEVEQGATDGGGRDALVVGGVLGIEGARAVQADSSGRRGGREGR